jgi:hypothetical protein
MKEAKEYGKLYKFYQVIISKMNGAKANAIFALKAYLTL